MTDTSASQATLEENKAVIRRFVEEVQNRKSEEAYWELNDPDFVNLAPPPGSRRSRGRVRVPLRIHERLSGLPRDHRRHDRRGRSGRYEEDVHGHAHRRVRGNPADRQTRHSPVRRHHAGAGRKDRRALELHRPTQLHAAARRDPGTVVVLALARETVRDADTPDSLLAARERQAGDWVPPSRGRGTSSPTWQSVSPGWADAKGSVRTSSVSFALGNPTAGPHRAFCVGPGHTSMPRGSMFPFPSRGVPAVAGLAFSRGEQAVGISASRTVSARAQGLRRCRDHAQLLMKLSWSMQFQCSTILPFRTRMMSTNWSSTRLPGRRMPANSASCVP